MFIIGSSLDHRFIQSINYYESRSERISLLEYWIVTIPSSEDNYISSLLFLRHLLVLRYPFAVKMEEPLTFQLAVSKFDRTTASSITSSQFDEPATGRAVQVTDIARSWSDLWPGAWPRVSCESITYIATRYPIPDRHCEIGNAERNVWLS